MRPHTLSTFLVLALAPVALGQTHCVPSFPMPQVSIDDSARQIAFADLNADGIDDLVGTQETDDRIAVCFGLGGSAFADPVFYPVGDNPHTLTLADLNNDGFEDIVVGARGNGVLTPLLNDQSGGFTPGTDLVTGADYFHLTSGDVNGDGFDDISACDALARAIFIYFSDGAGALSLVGQAYFQYTPYGSALGDLDGDNLVDLVIAIPSAINPLGGNGAVWSYFNLGNDEMGLWNGFTGLPAVTGTSPFPKRVRIANVDGVGLNELVVACDQFSADTGRVDVLSDLVGGVYQTQDVYIVGESAPDVAVGDLDDNGSIDIVTISNVDEDIASVLLNNGDGTYAPPVAYDAPGNHLFQSVELGDLNQDGLPDPMFGHISGEAVVGMLNTGAGVYGAPGFLPDPDGPFGLRFAHMDGDTNLDMVVYCANGNVKVYPGMGDGSFGMPVDNPGGPRSQDIPIADFDGDLIPDVVVTDGMSIKALMNNGSGTLSPGLTSDPIPNASFLQRMAVGFFDNDLNPDIAISISANANPWNRIQIFNGDGIGGFTLGQTITGLGSNSFVLLAGNVDGDSDTDLVVLRPYINDGITVIENDGTGTFTTKTNYPLYSGAQPQAGVLIDLGGDANPDLALAVTDGIAIMENTGGAFTWIQTYPVGPGIFGIDAGDLDGDGDQDLACTVSQGNTINTDSLYGVALLMNEGSMAFDAGAPLFAGSIGGRTTRIEDLDDDGNPDIITTSTSVNGLEFLMSAGCGAPASPCIGDANGDLAVNFADVTTVLGNWNADYTPGTGPGDANVDGLVNFADVTSILGNWNNVCP